MPGTELGGGHLTSDKADTDAAFMELTFQGGDRQQARKQINKRDHFRCVGDKCNEGKKRSKVTEHLKWGRHSEERPEG